MAKLSSLILFTLIVSIIAQFFSVYNIIVFSYQTNIIAMTFRGFDCAMNALCLLLQWPFSIKYYKMLCNPCHKIMIQRCANNMVINTSCTRAINNQSLQARTVSTTDNSTVDSNA